jgi:predicted ATPase
MHIKSVKAVDFRRFTNLEIKDIPADAKLVVLAGPNGNGKSSLFDAFLKFFCQIAGFGGGWENEYHAKLKEPGYKFDISVDIAFHEKSMPDNLKKLFNFRSAYRNDPQFSQGAINQQGPALDEQRFKRFIDNDVAVHINYQRLYAQSLEDLFESEPESTTVKEFREKVIGDIRESLRQVLPELTLHSLGNPFKVHTFRFSKGAIKNFNYMNLSGGEKAAFDLILDYVIKRSDFDNTVFCIDETEAHLNPRVQAKLLDALLGLTQPKSQLWIATHAIGMLRRARDLYNKSPNEVAFLDFEKDFDQPQILAPVVPDRVFWQRSLEIALDDMAELVAPRQIIACESGKKDGTPGEGIDAQIYNTIFAAEFPETRFVSIGSTSDMKGDRYLVVQAVAGLIEGTKTTRLIDRDNMSDAEIAEHEKKGYRVLRRRQIESYLFADEILTRLCDKEAKPDKIQELLAARRADLAKAVKQGHAAEDIKKASGRIRVSCERILQLKNAGKSTGAFMRDTLAPLVTPETEIYRELKAVIFA